MNPHTTWYPADEPNDFMYDHEARQQRPSAYHEASPEEQSLSMLTLPFRFVTIAEGAPYPLHEVQQLAEQPFMVDLLSGDQWHRGGSIRQPVAEDYLRPQHPLPAPPVEEHDSDQELPVIEPDSYLDPSLSTVQQSHQPHDVGTVSLGRRDTIATTKPFNIVKPDPAHKRSKSALALPSHTARPSSLAESGRMKREDTAVHVPSMTNDFFSPVLGGLQRLPSAPPKKESKSERLKRFFSFRRGRKYGRASR